MSDELVEKVRSITIEEMKEHARSRRENPENYEWSWDYPENFGRLDFSQYSLAEVLNFEEARIMTLARKWEHYHAVKEGWDKARYCDCGADSYYECAEKQECDQESMKNRIKYVKQKRREVLGINRKLNTIHALQWKLSGIEQSETLGDHILQGREDYPMLRKKIAQMTGKAVQNFEETDAESRL